MRKYNRVIYTLSKVLTALCFSGVVATVSAQVLPSEVTNYRARAAESKYLPQLETLQHQIGSAEFPHPFLLARYVNAKSGRASTDRDGIEFVDFQHRIVLKVSGQYKVAFDAGLKSENQRVTQTLMGAVVPLLRMASETVPAGDDYDGIGLEILYDTHDSNSNYSFEGREVLSVVFSRSDAVAFVNAATDEARQEILSRTDLFVSGKPFGVALGQRNPIEPGSSEDRAMRTAPDTTDSAVLVRASTALRAASNVEATAEPVPLVAADVHVANQHVEQTTLSSLEKSGDQVLMHVSLQNSLAFNGANTSIYKRAAQSFDLFLGPGLGDVIKALPVDAKFDAFKFSVVNHVANGATASETIDYICPVTSTRAFLDNKITSQDLINQSTVLVNGMRIGLNLAAVE
jgi:hypothetical protein